MRRYTYTIEMSTAPEHSLIRALLESSFLLLAITNGLGGVNGYLSQVRQTCSRTTTRKVLEIFSKLPS